MRELIGTGTRLVISWDLRRVPQVYSLTMSDPSLPLPNLDLPASIAEARMFSESGYANPIPN